MSDTVDRPKFLLDELRIRKRIRDAYHEDSQKIQRLTTEAASFTKTIVSEKQLNEFADRDLNNHAINAGEHDTWMREEIRSFAILSLERAWHDKIAG